MSDRTFAFSAREIVKQVYIASEENKVDCNCLHITVYSSNVNIGRIGRVEYR